MTARNCTCHHKQRCAELWMLQQYQTLKQPCWHFPFPTAQAAPHLTTGTDEALTEVFAYSSAKMHSHPHETKPDGNYTTTRGNSCNWHPSTRLELVGIGTQRTTGAKLRMRQTLQRNHHELARHVFAVGAR